jgi:hypothetical protein
MRAGDVDINSAGFSNNRAALQLCDVHVSPTQITVAAGELRIRHYLQLFAFLAIALASSTYALADLDAARSLSGAKIESAGSVDEDAEEAYRQLERLPAHAADSTKRDCLTWDNAHVRMLKPWVAKRVAWMAQAFLSTHGKLTILSAYRSSEDQKCVCEGAKGLCAGWKQVKKHKGKGPERETYFVMVETGGRSRHASGVAVDMRPGTGTHKEYQCFNEFLRRNPQFGLHLPLFHRWDRAHVEPAQWRDARKTKKGKTQSGTRVASLIGLQPAPVTPCGVMDYVHTEPYTD